MELHELDPDPIRQFQLWYDEAQRISRMQFPESMALATVDAQGRPAVRMVLFKGLHEGDFTFVTNFESRKARDLAHNAHAALCFFWDWTGHQVRVEGVASRMPDTYSDAYFRTRPRGSQVAAWASPQSREIRSRDELLERAKEVEKRFGSETVIPRPPNWGAFRIRAERIELWRNGEHRLHDRFEYVRGEDGWQARRLAP
jgi:pyridoxamine 5'-phosphate oxidase